MKRTRRFVVPFAIPLLMLAATWILFGAPRWLSAASPAATIPIGSCSEAGLNAALALAAADSAPDIITFPSGCTLITLSTQKQITTNVTIDGGAQVVLRASGAIRHFEVQSAGSLTLKAIRLSNGAPATGDGGAVVAHHGGSLQVEDSEFVNNRSPNSGGAIAISGLTAQPRSIVNTTFLSNSAVLQGGAVSSGSGGSGPVLTILGSQFISNTARDGGGVGVSSTTLWVTSTLFLSNTSTNFGYGAGLYNNGSGSAANPLPFFITDSEFRANRATYYSGGLHAQYVDLRLISSSFTANRANFGGGARIDLSTAVVSNTTFISNGATIDTNGPGSGGALRIGDSTVVIESSEFVSNTASAGGGAIQIQLSSDYTEVVLLRDSVFGGNWAPNGDALHFFKIGAAPNPVAAQLENVTLHKNGLGTLSSEAVSLIRAPLEVRHATITGNGTGIAINSGSAVTLTNSVLQNEADCTLIGGGTVASASYSLFAGSTCGTGGAGNLFDASEQLGPLLNNGGSTFTRLPEPGSLVLNSADPAACLPTDQRGVARQPAACDMGAAELIDSDGPAATATAQAQATATAQAAPTATFEAQVTATAQAQATATAQAAPAATFEAQVTATAQAQATATAASATATAQSSITPGTTPVHTSTFTPTPPASAPTETPTSMPPGNTTPVPNPTPHAAGGVYLNPVQRP